MKQNPTERPSAVKAQSLLEHFLDPSLPHPDKQHLEEVRSEVNLPWIDLLPQEEQHSLLSTILCAKSRAGMLCIY
jgi:hypothetical protein